jgi:hypothetical protein
MRSGRRQFRCIVGPFGSGKSAACAVELFRRACQQQPDAQVRRTRWAAIARPSALRNTTIGVGGNGSMMAFRPSRLSPTPQHHIIMPLANRTILDMRVDSLRWMVRPPRLI